MDKKKNLSAEDRALFAEAVKNVKPLSKNNKNFLHPEVIKHPPKKKFTPIPTPSLILPQYPLVDLDALAPEDWVGVEEKMSFHRSGLQNKVLKKLAHGQVSLTARLDLHRLTLTAALAHADAFLRHCQQQSHRWVLIIHGKGKKSDKPILKNALNMWLRAQALVLAFHTAQPKDGGAGAVYVLIKNQEKLER